MSEEKKIISKALCGQCKHYEYIDRFLAVCQMGRPRTEFREDGGITTCPYWENIKPIKIKE